MKKARASIWLKEDPAINRRQHCRDKTFDRRLYVAKIILSILCTGSMQRKDVFKLAHAKSPTINTLIPTFYWLKDHGYIEKALSVRGVYSITTKGRDFLKAIS